MKCANLGCGAELAANLRHCVACGADAGAPNVRAANDAAEVSALGVRFADESHLADDKGYRKSFDRALELAASSRAIICMSSARLLSIASDPTSLLATFGLQVESEMRVPLDNRFDAIRASVQEAYFPNYSKEIRFAALSLSEVGHQAYGACSATLKDVAIENRASVFEFPLFYLADKVGIKLGQKIPFGHRAPWKSREKLVTVKLGGLVADKSDGEIAALLLPEPSDTLADCVEVHVHGPLNRYSLQSVVFRPEKRRADKAIQQAICDELNEAEIPVRYVA